MRGTAKLMVMAAGASACLSAGPAAACFRHTFEACPAEATSNYTIVLDRKTGRTWLKAPPDADGKDEKLAELAAAAAKNLAVKPISGAQQARAAGWRTRVEAKAGPAPRN